MAFITNFLEVTGSEERLQAQKRAFENARSFYPEYISEHLTERGEGDIDLAHIVNGNDKLVLCIAAAMCLDSVELWDNIRRPRQDVHIEIGKYSIEDCRNPILKDRCLVCYNLTITINHTTHKFAMYFPR